jgi:hypothetical protein
MAQSRRGASSHHVDILWVAPILLALLGCEPADSTSNSEGTETPGGGSAPVDSAIGGTTAKGESEHAGGGNDSSASSEEPHGGTAASTTQHASGGTGQQTSGGTSSTASRRTGRSGGSAAAESAASGGRSSSKSTTTGGSSAGGSSTRSESGGANSSSTSAAGIGAGGTLATDGTKASSGGAASTSTGGACLYTGHVSYTLAKESQPTAQQQAAYDKITQAMDAAIRYYNCYTDITKVLNISYVPSVATADGNINGSIRFGSNASMNKVTAMHEISHTVGIGTASKWSSLLSNGQFTGANAKAEVAKIPVLNAADGIVRADNQHFWPGGLNYESEGKSEADLIAHCRMVVAIRKDLAL